MTILIENGAVLSLPQGKLIVHNPGYVLDPRSTDCRGGSGQPTR